MTLSLDSIKSKTKNKKSRRIGRGDGSGRGTYSGRGIKGQKCRSGVSGLKRLGMKPLIKQTPKKRGFHSNKPSNQVVKIEAINKNFKDSDIINPEILVKLGLIKSAKLPIKILGSEDLKIKKLSVRNIKLSKTALDQLVKQGGSLK
ncbi:50S ribosomal protein L15 [bacterium]|nr:50S ribosomal protein L15 [bacterium]